MLFGGGCFLVQRLNDTISADFVAFSTIFKSASASVFMQLSEFCDAWTNLHISYLHKGSCTIFSDTKESSECARRNAFHHNSFGKLLIMCSNYICKYFDASKLHAIKNLCEALNWMDYFWFTSQIFAQLNGKIPNNWMEFMKCETHHISFRQNWTRKLYEVDSRQWSLRIKQTNKSLPLKYAPLVYCIHAQRVFVFKRHLLLYH